VVGAPAVGVELVDDGWSDEGLDPADEERELDEQALSEMAAAASNASVIGPPRNRVRASLAIEFHFVVGRAAVGP
jgi:hypothetical protein